MTKDEDFKLLKIQTCVLRVNIHCDGCKQKVKKLLQRIEGVYQVNIDAEQQKVTVSGGVDAATLIKKLVRAGKHAELWLQKGAQNHKQKANCIKDDKNKDQKQGLMKGLEALKNQQKFPFTLQDDEDFLDDDVEEDDEEDELRFVREKANQINLLRQKAAAIEGNNAKKGFGAMAAAAAAGPNNGKMNIINNNNNGGNANPGKKGNPNQNMGMKANPGGIVDQKTMAALKMNNAQLSGANTNPGEVKMGNDISSMMNLAGFHGNGANNIAAVLGGNPNITGNFHPQVQAANNGFMGSSSAGFPTTMVSGNHHHHPSSMMMNMNGYQQQQYPSSMLMNLQNRHAMQQPQMMYNRSPFIPPNTGYYYDCGPVPYTTTSYTTAEHHYHTGGDHSATHMFSDDNTSSCSIM